MVRGIASTENGVMVVEPAVEPGAFYRLWILIEESLEERRIAHMKLFGRDTNNWSYTTKISQMKLVALVPDLPYILCRSVM
jgi:hypothetical protein